MTFRELQVMLMLYEACTDRSVRRRAAQLLPELEDLAADLKLKLDSTKYTLEKKGN